MTIMRRTRIQSPNNAIARLFRQKAGRMFSLLLCSFFILSPSAAQEVRVMVNHKYDPMPPAAMMYADDPGRFFTVTLQNNSDRALKVFLGIEIEKQGDNRVSLHTPVKNSPSKGVDLSPRSVKTLTSAELKQLFYYMKLSDVSINGAIMSDFTTGKQPLLPEGYYNGRVVVYEVDYQAERPTVLSDPSDGVTTFWICYNAKAPQIVTPNTTNDATSLLQTDFTIDNGKTLGTRTLNQTSKTDLLTPLSDTSRQMADGLRGKTFVDNDPVTTPSLAVSTPVLNPNSPLISWMAPQQNCSGGLNRFKYAVEIARLLNGQSPEEALRYKNNIMLTTTGLLSTTYMIPSTVLKQMMQTGGYFVARVRAVPYSALQIDPTSNRFVLVENDGYSPLCVFKVEKAEKDRPNDHTIIPSVPDDDDNDTDDDDEDDVTVPEFLVGKPHLTTPQPSTAVDSRILHTGDSICLAWQKPQLVKGTDKERYEKLTFKYKVQLYKYKTGQPLDSMLLTDAIYKRELSETDLKNGLKDTIRWSKMEKALERSEQLYVMVDATIENDKEARIDSTDKKNIAKLAFLKTAAETFGDCNAGYSETISDKTLSEDFTTQNLKDKEVKIGEFTMVVEEIELVEIKGKEDKDKDKDKDKESEKSKEKAYKGTGYVKWNPYGNGFKIAVEFDSLWINANKEAYRGKVRSSRNPKALDKTIKENIPYDMFDDLDVILGAGVSKEYADKYADKLAGKLEGYYKTMNDYADRLSLITSDGLNVLQLPVALPRTSKDNPVSIQLFSAEFSPNTAWINVFAQMAIPECSQVESSILAFTAPHICITPDAPLTDGIASLMGDFTFTDPKTNFGFTFRSPSQFDKPDDGTWISWSTDKEKKEMQMDSVQVQIEMSLNGLLKDDGKGGTVKGEVPVARMQARFKDWGDWMAKAEVEPFQSKELPGYTFDMTNGGMWYDHSSDQNPKEMKLPKDKGYEDTALKDDNQWQGFWLKQAKVQMPFDAEDKDSSTDKKRVSFSIDELFVDKHGFTVDFNVNDVGRIKESGWSISLDHAYARVVQNSFKYAGLKGAIGMPVFDDGDLPYEAKMSLSDEEFLMELSVKPEKDKPLSIKAWRIQATLDEASRVNMMWGSKQGFSIGALFSGKLSLDVGESAGAYIPDVTFKNMYIANYDMVKENASLAGSESSENKESRTAAKNHGFYYSIGDWGLSGGDAAKNLLSQQAIPAEVGDLWAYHGGHGPSPAAAPLPANDEPLAEAEVGGFKVTLDQVSFIHENMFGRMGVYVKASGSILYDQLKASIGMKLWGKMNWDTYKLSYDDVKFHDISVSGSFGGSACTVKGDLTMLDEDGESGWKASLDFEIRELFKMVAAGKFSKVKDDKRTYHSFALSLGMKSETGIPIGGVVSIDSIGGGFYYNSKLDMKASYGTCAFALGVGMKTTGTSNLMNGKLDGLIIYDYAKKSLSKIRFDGKVHALCGTNRNKGLINTDVMIEYNNDDKERAFRIQATMQGGVSEQDLLAQCKDFVGNDSKFQKLCNKLQDVSDMANDELNEFGVGSGDKNKSTEKTKTRKEIEGKSEIKASAGLKLSFDFAVVYQKSDKKTKWHVYVGEPTRDKRCTLTLIDFQLGSKSSSVAAWCRIYANAYVCLGNELPNGGALPDLPEKVQNYLYKTNKNVDANNGTEAATTQKRKAEFNKITTASGNSPGGVMFGAEAGGEFGVNAVLCYARADLVAGFDVAMLFARDMMCSNGKPAGKHGFYCNGQVYGYAGGQLGLMINTRLWSGKFPIVDAGIGALLKGGFVNPTWVYGKLKAHCKLLGGLIKFKSTIEVKAGDICLPVAKNPLEDIKIFSGADPGYESSSEGWEKENEVSKFTRINFSTNMAIGADLRLLDENIAIQQAGIDGDQADYAKNAERIFRFTLDNTMPLYIHRIAGTTPAKTGELVGNYNYQSIAGKNNEEFYLKMGPAVLEPNQCYHVTLTGHGYEMVNGVQKNPLSIDTKKMQQGIREPWDDTYTLYFRTGPQSTNLTDYVQFSFPENGATIAPKDEWMHPVLVLKDDASSFMTSSDYEYYVELQKQVWTGNQNEWKTISPCTDGYRQGNPVLKYHSTFGKYHYIDVYQHNEIYRYNFDNITNMGGWYRYVFYRVRKADMDNAINALTKYYNTTTLAATGNYDAQGNSINSEDLTAQYQSTTVDGVKLNADGKSVTVTGADGKTYVMPLDTEYESMNAVIAAYNEEFDKAVGSDNRESRVTEMVRRTVKKEAFTDQIYEIQFKPNAKTLQEMIDDKDCSKLAQQDRLYTQFLDMGSPVVDRSSYNKGVRPAASYTEPSLSSIKDNPYTLLNYLTNRVFLNGITLPKGFFFENSINSAQGLGLKFTNNSLRGNVVNGSDGTWHGTLFESNVNRLSIRLGDNLYKNTQPFDAADALWTGPIDHQRKVRVSFSTSPYYSDYLLGSVYYTTLQTDAILAWRVQKAVAYWADLYTQYYKNHTGQSAQRKWAELMKGNIDSGVSGSYKTERGGDYWNNVKKKENVGEGGIRNTSYYTLSTLQYPIFMGLWSQWLDDNKKKDGYIGGHNDNAKFKIENLTNATGYNQRSTKQTWEVLNSQTFEVDSKANSTGWYKPMVWNNNQKEFDWQNYLKTISKMRYVVFKPNAYDVTTGEDDILPSTTNIKIVTVNNPFKSGWTFPIVNGFNY